MEMFDKDGNPLQFSKKRYKVTVGLRENGTAWISIGDPNAGPHAATDLDLPSWAAAAIALCLEDNSKLEEIVKAALEQDPTTTDVYVELQKAAPIIKKNEHGEQ